MGSWARHLTCVYPAHGPLLALHVHRLAAAHLVVLIHQREGDALRQLHLVVDGRVVGPVEGRGREGLFCGEGEGSSVSLQFYTNTAWLYDTSRD